MSFAPETFMHPLLNSLVVIYDDSQLPASMTTTLPCSMPKLNKALSLSICRPECAVNMARMAPGMHMLLAAGFPSVFDPAALRNHLTTPAIFQQTVQHCSMCCTDPMREPSDTRPMLAAFRKGMVPDLFLCTASVLVCLSDDTQFLIFRGLHIVRGRRNR